MIDVAPYSSTVERCQPAPRNVITIERRWELCALPCALDGKPAAICGALCPFATVAALDGSAAHQWAWINVERIVARGGSFTS